jgi:hypothetical protein
MQMTKVTSRAMVGGACTGALLAVPLADAALADSEVIGVSFDNGNGNYQCFGKWWTDGGQGWFEIADNDLDDSDYCYVSYGWASGDSNNAGRFNNPQDVKGWNSYPVNITNHPTIWWKLCKERQNDPDICSVYMHNSTAT